MPNRVGGTEGGLEETNAELDKTNNELARQQEPKAESGSTILEQSQADLEQRFDNAFEESLDGVAIAMALSPPDLVAGERFAMKVNLGTY